MVTEAGLTFRQWCYSFKLDPKVILIVEFDWIGDELYVPDVHLRSLISKSNARVDRCLRSTHD